MKMPPNTSFERMRDKVPIANVGARATQLDR
jgi:hypothetical protein